MNAASWPAPAKWIVLLALSVGITALWSHGSFRRRSSSGR